MKDTISDNATIENMGLLRRKREYDEQLADILISDCGVYKIGMDPRSRKHTSAVDRSDFRPDDFINSRNKKL